MNTDITTKKHIEEFRQQQKKELNERKVYFDTKVRLRFLLSIDEQY
jgi:hypothetical protein